MWDQSIPECVVSVFARDTNFSYNIMHVPAIESYLKKNLVYRGDDQSRYERSLEIEPREQYVLCLTQTNKPWEEPLQNA